jgi:hypothetical protein
MMRTRNVRRQIVDRVLKGIPIRPHFAISLKNAQVKMIFDSFDYCNYRCHWQIRANQER